MSGDLQAGGLASHSPVGDPILSRLAMLQCLSGREKRELEASVVGRIVEQPSVHCRARPRYITFPWAQQTLEGSWACAIFPVPHQDGCLPGRQFNNGADEEWTSVPRQSTYVRELGTGEAHRVFQRIQAAPQESQHLDTCHTTQSTELAGQRQPKQQQPYREGCKCTR